jgi:hypothetical protein
LVEETLAQRNRNTEDLKQEHAKKAVSKNLILISQTVCGRETSLVPLKRPNGLIYPAQLQKTYRIS